MKRSYGWTRLLIFFLYQISGSVVLCNSVNGDVKIREKRNLICDYGLTDVVKDTLYSTLEDTREQDPLSLDDAWDGQLHHGVLQGLSTLTNTTDLEVFCNENDLVVFTTTLRMENAMIWYKWTRRVVFKLEGSVWMKAKKVEFDLEVRLDTACGLKFWVTNSLITKMDEFTIGFKGLGLLNPLVEKILKKVWKGKVAGKIGVLLKKALERKLGRIASTFDWFL